MPYNAQPDFRPIPGWSYANTLANIETIKGARSKNALADQQMQMNEQTMQMNELQLQFRDAIARGDLKTAMRIDPTATQELLTKRVDYEIKQRANEAGEASTIMEIIKPYTRERDKGGRSVMGDEELMQWATLGLQQLQARGLAKDMQIGPDTTADQIRAVLDETERRNRPLLEPEKWKGGQAAVGPDGKPVLIQTGDRGGVREIPGYGPAPTKDLEIWTDADGNQHVTFGTGGSGGDISKKTQGTLEDKIINSQSALDRMSRLYADFDESDFGFSGAVKKWWLGSQAWVAPDMLSPAEQKAYYDYTKYIQKVAENANTMIREMTGAQMSEHEAERLLEGIPNAQDDAIAFKGKMDALMNSLALINARARYYLANGWEPPKMTAKGVMKPGESWRVSIDGMETIIHERADQLEELFKAEGMANPRDAALSQTNKEFGL